jgi:hypothetical protein
MHSIACNSWQSSGLEMSSSNEHQHAHHIIHALLRSTAELVAMCGVLSREPHCTGEAVTVYNTSNHAPVVKYVCVLLWLSACAAGSRQAMNGD